MPGTKIAESLRREQIVNSAYELAARRGLRAVTIREVAHRARISAGLVLFHFRTKRRLLLALLDFVLVKTTTIGIDPDIADFEDPLEHFIVVLREEMKRLSTDPVRNRLFFEFWSHGMWDRGVRNRIQRELDRYRAAFRPLAKAVIAANPDRFARVPVASLAALAVSFIKGCAVQSMVEPELDVSGYLRAAEGLLSPTHVFSA